MDVTKHGESVYKPSPHRATRKSGEGRRRPSHGPPGPPGQWIKLGDPGYDQALAEQRRLEQDWIDARNQTGDG